MSLARQIATMVAAAYGACVPVAASYNLILRKDVFIHKTSNVFISTPNK